MRLSGAAARQHLPPLTPFSSFTVGGALGAGRSDFERVRPAPGTRPQPLHSSSEHPPWKPGPRPQIKGEGAVGQNLDFSGPDPASFFIKGSPGSRGGAACCWHGRTRRTTPSWHEGDGEKRCGRRFGGRIFALEPSRWDCSGSGDAGQIPINPITIFNPTLARSSPIHSQQLNIFFARNVLSSLVLVPEICPRIPPPSTHGTPHRCPCLRKRVAGPGGGARISLGSWPPQLSIHYLSPDPAIVPEKVYMAGGLGLVAKADAPRPCVHPPTSHSRHLCAGW
eukprot:gene5685-biopygen20766